MSATRYLLDSNALSQFARTPHGALANAIYRQPPAALCTSIVVACEIQFGLQRGGSALIRSRMREILGVVAVLPLESPVELHYAQIRAHLQSIGQLIGSNDMLIAAHARSLGLVAVTNNTREFSRVPGLIVEDWTIAP